jgi:uncharacterized membrane protein YqgA involved in biofilm formation
MTGTIINVVAILIGGGLGVVLGGRLPERLRQTVMSGLGLFTFAIGLQMFLKTQNSLIVLGSVLVGILLGEWWQVEEGLRRLGRWLEARVSPGKKGENGSQAEASADAASEDANQNRFVRGFFTSSLLFCVGPIAILGSIQDGLSGNYQLLAVKSVLDGFAAVAFASSLGIGVLFSSLPILVYQGGMSLLAAQIQPLVSQAMMNEMTATGGVLLMAIAIGNLLEIRPIRSGNFLPALLIAPLVVALLTALGIQWVF